MTKPVTIASVRAHGVRTLLVYCRGKQAGDWPCHHSATLSVDRFGADEPLKDIERRCRCKDGDVRTCVLTTAWSRQAGEVSVG
jgi:hypothetical protein